MTDELDEVRAAKEFEVAMRGIYVRARREAGYNATYFFRMLETLGGVTTARKLLGSAHISDGFTSLWEASRLDLTVEALVLQKRFSSLFTDEELDVARRRLREFGFPLPS